MRKQKTEELVLEYLNEIPNSKRRNQIKKILLVQGYSESHLIELERIYSDLNELPTARPDELLNTSFYNMLEDNKHSFTAESTIWSRILSDIDILFEPRYILRAAYSIILLFIGWNIGYWTTSGNGQENEIRYLTSEVQQMKKMVSISMLNQASPSERIKNVNTISSFGQADEQIITTLINTLNNDANVNVRLSAVEALFKLSKNSRVRESLVHSLANQESPLIQLALVDCYVALNETQAVAHLKHLLQNKDINDVVRNQVEQTLKILI